MSEPLRFVVPMPPHVTNRARGSTHWRRAYTEKREYWNTLDYIACSNGAAFPTMKIPRPPGQPFECVAVRSLMHLGGAMDDDNALARHKPLLDWLKTRGYLVDDRKKNVVWEALPDQKVRRDNNYRIELTVTPLPSESR